MTPVRNATKGAEHKQWHNSGSVMLACNRSTVTKNTQISDAQLHYPDLKQSYLRNTMSQLYSKTKRSDFGLVSTCCTLPRCRQPLQTGHAAHFKALLSPTQQPCGWYLGGMEVRGGRMPPWPGRVRGAGSKGEGKVGKKRIHKCCPSTPAISGTIRRVIADRWQTSVPT